MKRYIIRNTETGEFLSGTGRHTKWTSFDKADLYKGKLTDFWWEECMELVEVSITICE